MAAPTAGVDQRPHTTRDSRRSTVHDRVEQRLQAPPYSDARRRPAKWARRRSFWPLFVRCVQACRGSIALEFGVTDGLGDHSCDRRDAARRRRKAVFGALYQRSLVPLVATRGAASAALRTGPSRPASRASSPAVVHVRAGWQANGHGETIDAPLVEYGENRLAPHRRAGLHHALVASARHSGRRRGSRRSADRASTSLVAKLQQIEPSQGRISSATCQNGGMRPSRFHH